MAEDCLFSLLLGDIESSELVRFVCGLSESLCRCPTGSLPLGKVGEAISAEEKV